MPTLNWIGKDAVINHHKEVPFRLLKPIDKLSVGEDSGNLFVQGDNLEALKALLPYYAGQVKCIYIDSPYNTGNEGWVYNYNVKSPEMKAWLGKVVGGEGEDLSRHDKWLSMMYPRLGQVPPTCGGFAGRDQRVSFHTLPAVWKEFESSLPQVFGMPGRFTAVIFATPLTIHQPIIASNQALNGWMVHTLLFVIQVSQLEKPDRKHDYPCHE